MQKSLTRVNAFRAFGLFLFAAYLSGCAPTPPTGVTNACNIFKQYPKWYWEAKKTQKKWGVPVSTQMAIFKQESHFVADARPPRTTLFGFIPWTRPTSAYGYAQATDGTWSLYLRNTGQSGRSRTNFGDATDFLGWYSMQAQKKLHISPSDAYSLYLAYHEGLGGYAARSYRKKSWLMGVAKKVQTQATAYYRQLRHCRDDIVKPSIWNLWFA